MLIYAVLVKTTSYLVDESSQKFIIIPYKLLTTINNIILHKPVTPYISSKKISPEIELYNYISLSSKVLLSNFIGIQCKRGIHNLFNFQLTSAKTARTSQTLLDLLFIILHDFKSCCKCLPRLIKISPLNCNFYLLKSFHNDKT